MTVNSTTRKTSPFIGNDLTTQLPFGFMVFAAADVLVTKAVTATGVETVLALGTDYSVSLNSNQATNPGGTVILTAALATGYTSVVSSQVQALQKTDITNAGGFYPDIIEAALDKQMIVTQQLAEQVDRCAKLPITNTADATKLSYDIERLAASADNIDVVANNVSSINTNATNITAIQGASANALAAAASASAASTSATNSSNSATGSANSASAASASASSASLSATSATASASAAASSATSAGSSETNAGSSAAAAATSATSANVSATTAGSAATNASNSASAASASATNASSSATSASGSASSAAAAATSAGISATNAASSATAAANSAASIGFTLTSTSTLQNKTLDNTNTVTVKDANFTIQDDGDVTKQAKIQASGISTGQTRTITLQDASLTVAGIDVNQSFSKAQRGTVVALTDGATITPDFSAGNNFSVTLGGNRTLANPTNLTAGQSGVIVVTQDATGSRTLAFGSYFKFASGTAPTLTATANAVDLIAYYVDSATRISARFVGDVK